MSPMLKALLAVKERGYNPPGPPPIERLALISDAERRLLKRLGGAGKLTRSGIPSFYMEGSTTGKREDSKPSQSKTTTASKTTQSKTTTNNNGPQNQNNPGGAGPSKDGGNNNNSKTGGYNNNNNNGPQNKNNPGGTGPSQANTRTSEGLGRGINTPTAAGSPSNNPTRINAMNSMQDMRNKATQRATQAALAAQTNRAQQLQQQYSQFRSPADFPYAGAEDLTRDEYNRVQAGADIRPQNYGFQAPVARPRSIAGIPANVRPQNYGFVSPSKAETYDEDLRRPDLADPSMVNGDWNFDPATGLRTPVYNPIAEGAIPTPRPSPLRVSPKMRTPQGMVDMWDPQANAAGEMFDETKLTPEAQAMVKNMKLAAFNRGYLVQPFSGLAKRKTGTTNHPTGNAVDMRMIDPATGKALGNFQDKETFGDYEGYAKAVRASQVANNPELSENMRWGGYFSDKGMPFGGNAVDMMHFDVNPKMRGAMGLGSWETGAGKKLAAAYGLGKPTVMAAADIPIPRQKPTVMRNIVKPGINAIKSFLAPQAPIPIPRQKPMQSNIVAPATSIPIPRQRPMVPSTVAKPTGIPIPRQKPSYPSTVAPATRIPIPRQKPAQTQVAYAEPTITPAGWSLNDIPGVDKIKTTYNTVNENVLKPIAQGVETYGQDATQRYVNAKIAAARNKQTRPTRYAQYGNMNRRRRQPITMGYV